MKIEEYGDLLFVVLYMVEFDEDDEFKVGELNVFVGLNYVLLICNYIEYDFCDVCKCCECELYLLWEGLVFVFYVLMD